MMYHKNRLIKAYHRVGCQLKVSVRLCAKFLCAFLLVLRLQLGCMRSYQARNRRSVGVIGVIECNHLTPTHNKQDFDNDDAYR